MEKKTYFEKLVDLINGIENPCIATKAIAEDCMYRALCWKESHEELGIMWQNDDYVKRQYSFMKQCLNK